MGATGILARLYNTVVEAAERLDRLREMGLRTWVEELAALHLLQVQAQALIDMAKRFAAELGYTPSTTREAIQALRREGVINDAEARLLKSIAGFRNIVVHEYATVDMRLVRRLVEEREYSKPVVLAAKLLEEAHKRGIDP